MLTAKSSADQRGAHDDILWDVITEHLDEAGFLWMQWERALRSSHYTLSEIAQTVEKRMLAHLDGLVIGGDAVAERFLWPALISNSSTEEEVFAATFAILDGLRNPLRSAPHLVEVTIGRLLGLPFPHRPALGRAFLLAAPRQALPMLQLLLDAPSAHHRLMAMQGLYGLRALPAGMLPRLLLDPEPLVSSFALGLVGDTADPAASLVVAMRHHMRATSPSAATLRAAALLGLPELPELCQNPHRLSRQAAAMALMLCAFSNNPQLHSALRQSLTEPSLARDALFALGFGGMIEDVEHCLVRLQGPLAPLATEAFVGITGVDLAAERLVAKAQANTIDDEAALADLDRDLSAQPEDELPVADSDLLVAWWQKNRSRFSSQVRYLHGLPDQGERTLLDLLGTATMRRRSIFSMALAVCSRGKCTLDTRDLAWRQQRVQDGFSVCHNAGPAASGH